MESSDLQQQRYSPHHLQESHQRQFEPHLKPQFHNSSGLTRFRSAPSSYLGNLMNSIPEPTANTNSEDFHLPRPLSPETESIISRFIHSFSGGSPGTDVVTSEPPPHSSNTLCDDVSGSLGMGAMGVMRQAAPLVGISVKHENYEQSGIPQSGKIDDDGSKKNNPSTSPIVYRGQPPSSNKPPLAGGIRSGGGSGNLNSGGMDRLFSPVVMKTGYGGGVGGGLTRSNPRSSVSSLVRHSSSPAGLFDDIHIEKGYLVTQGSGNQQRNYSSKIGSSPFPGSTHSTGGVGGGGISGGDRMRNTQTSTNAVPPSHSSGLMMLTKSDHIGEVLLEDKTVKRLKTEIRTDDEDNYLSGFPAWDDTAMFSDLLSGGSEREIGGGEVNNPSSENQSPGKARNSNNVGRGLLAHHMSLPKQRLEKLLEFEDSVPCKIRAKRGCATHPRSIAERVRRTKISERMRKLQDVVPNMDKQTSTADMLDLAVDHIKNLQNQLQMLNGKRARCTCTI